MCEPDSVQYLRDLIQEKEYLDTVEGHNIIKSLINQGEKTFTKSVETPIAALEAKPLSSFLLWRQEQQFFFSRNVFSLINQLLVVDLLLLPYSLLGLIDNLFTFSPSIYFSAECISYKASCRSPLLQSIFIYTKLQTNFGSIKNQFSSCIVQKTLF